MRGENEVGTQRIRRRKTGVGYGRGGSGQEGRIEYGVVGGRRVESRLAGRQRVVGDGGTRPIERAA